MESTEQQIQTSVLNRGHVLNVGESLISGNSLWKLRMQHDGNLVLSNKSGIPLWSTGTHNHPGANLHFQNSDGNLVIYYKKKAIWSAKVANKGGEKLRLQNDCNIVIYDKNKKAIWDSNTHIQDQNFWMSILPNKQSISKLSIPGTHDSCALYDFSSLRPYTSKCQNLSLTQQLSIGVRCLDIRLKKIDNNLRAWHGKNFFGQDQKINFLGKGGILSQCSKFLKTFNNEVIFMFIKREDGDDFSAIIEEEFSNSDIFWKGDIKNGEIMPNTLGDARGKIVLLNRFGDSPGIILSKKMAK